MSFDIAVNLGGGIEVVDSDVGGVDPYVKLALEGGHQAGESEAVDQTGTEQRRIGIEREFLRQLAFNDGEDIIHLD
jgi:hypothetical protein